jgi:hypothetical protein
MAKTKSASKKSTTNSAPQNADQGLVEARPIGEGKDPLAEGNTLVNPTNTEAETHYEVKERSADVAAAENTIDGQDANERAEQHNASGAAPVTANADSAEQDEVAEDRTEPGGDVVDDTPEEVDVPERSEEEEAADAEDREEALLQTDKTDK